MMLPTGGCAVGNGSWIIVFSLVGLLCGRASASISVSAAAVLREVQGQGCVCPAAPPHGCYTISTDCSCTRIPRDKGTPCTSWFTHQSCGRNTGSCDGQGNCLENPVDRGTVCRPAAGECDVPEVCDGVYPLCPDDVLVRADANKVCRPAGGLCDIEERCTGLSASCPQDAKRPPGLVCSRGSLEGCTVDAVCDGTNVACPAKGPVAAGTVCSKGADWSCIGDSVCDGAPSPCPANGPAVAGTVCRSPAGACDEPEICDGHAVICPPDALKANETVCEPGRSTCEKDAICTGTAAACPEHVVIPDGMACDEQSLCTAAGASCLAAACVGGTRIIGFDSTDVWVAPGQDATVLVRHEAGGDSIQLVEAIADPPDIFSVSGATSWPIQLASGETVSLTVKLLARAPDTYHGTLTVKATGCSDSDLQMQINGWVDGKPAPKSGCGAAAGGASLAALVLLGLLRRRQS